MKTELRSNEKVVLEIRKHWITLLLPSILTISLIFFGVIGIISKSGMLFPIISIFSIFYFAYKIIYRLNDKWIVTNFRVIDEFGVFSINSKDSPLDKINNVSFRQPLIGRFLNYGNIQIQTAAELGSTTHRMVERPKELKNAITLSQENFRKFHLGGQRIDIGKKSQRTNIAEELEALHSLMNKGIISEEEFLLQKKKLLEN